MLESDFEDKLAKLEERISLLESASMQYSPRTSMLLKGGKPLLTTQEAAELLGVKKNTVHSLVLKKKLPFYKPNGKNMYFDADELNRWLRHSRRTDDDV